MIIEVAELVWQDVGIGHEVEGRLAKALLHAHDVEAKPILARDLMALREVVDLLVFVEAFVLIRLAGARTP